MDHGKSLAVVAAAALLAFGYGCGDDDSTPTDSGMVDSSTDSSPTDTGLPPMTGCTNMDAANYDPDATVDDGSCLFTVTFSVDMTGYDYDRADGLAVQGSFCTDDCPTLADDDMDEVWSGTADLTIGTYEYNYAITSDPVVAETVPEFCQAEGSAVRGFAVVDGALTLDTVSFAGCTVLPMVVDGFYAASGFFGDSGDIDVTEMCPKRGGDGAGACRTWTYTRGTQGFAGVFWQYPEGNFGALPGFPVPRGATRVSFSAWGAAGGEAVKFLAGYGPDDSGPRDGFALETMDIPLTTTPTEYTMSLVGIDYDLVAGGFGWVAGLADGADPITFYIDDVVWERVEDDLTNVRGCMDSDASNYNAAATVDDGSCVYAVTFEVDMSCPDPADAFTTVFLTGPFCSFCDSGFELTDPDGDDIYTGTFDFPAGDLEHKFMTNNFASQEDLVNDVVAGMGSCAPVTDGSTFANRRIAVDSMPTTTMAVYGRCSACP